MNLSVVLITFNEENNLDRCLKSLPHGAEIIIVDSGSQDRTGEIASSYGARFQYRKFDDYSSQKNFALSLAQGKWILSLDADEVLSEGCVKEIEKIILGNQKTAYKINRHLYFMHKKMRFGKTRDHPIRLFPAGKGAFVGLIHESFEVEKDVATKKMGSKSIVYHYSYRDLEDYFDKFNRYTSRIAHNHWQQNKSIPHKAIIAVRPWLEFFSRFILRGGLLDGYPGYVYALLGSFYAFVKYEKFRQLSCSNESRRSIDKR
jgi:glycosyltransferase involved in cell wall biosynthesis